MNAKKIRRISEARFERKLGRLLERCLARTGGHVETFGDAGVLTTDKGLVVTLANRQEFQITIVESTRR